MSRRGSASFPALGSIWGLGGLSLYAFQTFTGDSSLVTFLADGVVVALVLFLVKKVNDMTGQVSGVVSSVKAINDRIKEETLSAERTHDRIHERLEKLEQSIRKEN